MENNQYNKYKLIIENGMYSCVESNGIKAKGFLKPDTSKNLSKLYVVKHGKTICYVGITQRDIRIRLRDGFTATGENGYHGYKWKELDEIELLVWSFPDYEIGKLESIEGELVFLVREKTGDWPKYQMEIHFHPGATESEKTIANTLFNVVKFES
jgi:hypothetical protein